MRPTGCIQSSAAIFPGKDICSSVFGSAVASTRDRAWLAFVRWEAKKLW
jgi:hypothetical protein